MVRFVLILFGCSLLFQTSRCQGTWKKKASLPEPRERAVAFSIGNFGYIGTGSSGFYEKKFWKYDPQMDTWEGIASMPTLARIGAFSFAINGKGYVGGGVNENAQSDREFWEYDPPTNQWSRKADLPVPGGFETLTSFSIEKKGYYLTTYRIDNFWEYDPETDVWLKKVNFPGLGRMDQVGFSIGTKGYIGTGFPGGLNNTKEFWEYDPTLNQWSRKADVPNPARAQAIGFCIGNAGFIGLGISRDGALLSDFWEYHPESDSWTQIENCGYAAFDAIAMNIGSKGYVGTGIGTTSGRDFWEYTPDLSSVNSIEQSDWVRLYPNPVSDRLHVDTSEPGPITFSIVTAHGQFVKTGQAKDNIIPVADLPMGIYFLRILSTNISLIMKFIKE